MDMIINKELHPIKSNNNNSKTVVMVQRRINDEKNVKKQEKSAK